MTPDERDRIFFEVFGQLELLPVLRTPSLGVLMEPEVGDGTTEFYARVQA
jgi:hypothetical protein